MKALKRTFFAGVALIAFVVFAIGNLNSFNLANKSAFLKNDLNIKFAKRLDDLTGKVVMGRMAASVPSWNSETKNNLVQKNLKKSIVTKKKNDSVKEEVASVKLPEPAIQDAPDLELTGGLYNKKPLEGGKGYSGRATIVDGVIEEINVNLPDGKEFILNTNKRMVGNVFEYEDMTTRELKTGLLYEIKEGHYMVNLTDDSTFSSLRLEFKTKNGAKIETEAYNNEDSWAMNEQNISENWAINEETPKEVEAANNGNVQEKDEYIHDDEDSFQETESFENEEEYIQTTEAIKAKTFAFKFASK